MRTKGGRESGIYSVPTRIGLRPWRSMYYRFRPVKHNCLGDRPMYRQNAENCSPCLELFLFSVSRMEIDIAKKMQMAREMVKGRDVENGRDVEGGGGDGETEIAERMEIKR
jgi:hypothetical protein